VIVLGLNGFAGADHDAAAALVVDGRVVAAVEEERLNRRRHAPGCEPTLAPAEVLRVAGIDAAEIDVVSHGWQPDALGLGVDAASERDRIRRALHAAGVPVPARSPLVFVDHHVAHLWCGIAYLPAGVDREAIDGLVVDGAGESTSGALFRVRAGCAEKVWNLGLEGSLGLLYEAATAAIGFRTGEEGKTMGLAAYGRLQLAAGIAAPPEDRFAGPIPRLGDRDELRRLYRRRVAQLRSAVPVGSSFNHRADVALGVQQVVESRIMAYLGEIVAPAPALVLAGGVALNCSVNATVAAWCHERGIALTVPPPANDGGIAIGAAVAASDEPVRCTVEGAFLGRDYPLPDIVARLRELGVEPRELAPEQLAGDLFERDLVCGWFEGRAEIGPRALGKRSVLARPDSTRVRDRLNVLKGRETWRPLAPSLLPGEFRSSFRGAPSPYMLVSSEAVPAAHRPLAGVIHVDNSARPQVLEGDPPGGPYARLLAAIERRTGHAAVTCTSFNEGGRPIVYSPDDALRAAIAMRLDVLAGDGWCLPVPKD
jgi:carbamoyltransferase